VQTFEIQVKVKESDLETMEARLKALPEVTFLRGSQRNQYDTYFIFDDAWGTRIRYREDEVINLETGNLIDVISRLTLTNRAKENEYEHSVLLSRARFDAPVTRSLRFYREYFKPEREVKVHKQRRRYHIRYGNTDFSLNLDRLIMPEEGGAFLEIKSRTWSRQDAERKAALIGNLLRELDIPDEALVKIEYINLSQNL
jgi:5-methylthioadenosine/S-adenosylhomocysteine deaminase